MSLYQDIRGALQTKLAAVSGVPQLVYEGFAYEPVIGTPFCVCQILPIYSRPATLGPAHLVWHRGTFELALVYPSGRGTGTAEAMADTIKAAFTADVTATQNNVTVRFRHAERRPIIVDTPWIRVPVSIAWYLYTETY